MLAGTAELVEVARRHRRMLGGAMRQAGILAAAGLYALAHNVERLAEDHANARIIAERLMASPSFELDPATVETNIIVFDLADAPGRPRRRHLRGRLPRAGRPPQRLRRRAVRAVTHLDVDADACARAAEIMVAAAG